MVMSSSAAADLLLPDEVVLASVVANSFKNFHTRGLSYLCVQRAAHETLKIYLFNGDVSKLPEVVNPHDHRYNFDTYVLAGAVSNFEFETVGPADQGTVMQRFAYRTPLNGGNGFTWAAEVCVQEVRAATYEKNDWYHSKAQGLHTIQIRDPETVLLLVQHEDLLPLDQPTSTFVRDPAATPTLDGLYERFSEDEALALLRRLHERAGISLLSRLR